MRQIFCTKILITIIVASFTAASTNYTAVCHEYQNWINDFDIGGDENDKKELRCKEKGKMTNIHFHETWFRVIHQM